MQPVSHGTVGISAMSKSRSTKPGKLRLNRVAGKSEGRDLIGRKTADKFLIRPYVRAGWCEIPVLIRPQHLGCRFAWLEIFRHSLFRFLVRVDHYLRVFTGKAAGKRKRAKNSNSKNLIHCQAFNVFGNQPNSSSWSEIPVDGQCARRSDLDEVTYFPDSVSKRTRSSFHNAAMVWLPCPRVLSLNGITNARP